MTNIFDLIDRNALEEICLLCESGADISEHNSSGETPLMYAVTLKFPQSVAILLGNGADPNDGGSCGFTPLQRAAAERQFDIVKTLLEYQPSLECAAKPMGTRALHYAAMNGAADIVTLLLEAGADCRATDSQGRTAREEAINFNHPSCAAAIDDFLSTRITQKLQTQAKENQAQLNAYRYRGQLGRLG